MRKLFTGISFWTFYTLGFTVGLPTVIYYTSGDMEAPPQESAGMAFFYLGFGILAWLIILVLYGRFFIQLFYLDKKQLEQTAKEGKTIIATITSCKQVGTVRNDAIFDLSLAFTNLAGSAVEMPYQLVDSKPYEKRFGIGKRIEMRANTAGQNAVFVPATIEVSLVKKSIIFYSIIFLVLLACAFVYPVFCYQLQSNGNGWRFLTITHPWIMVPLINIPGAALIWLFLRYIGKATGNHEQPLRMILCGIRTGADIVNYSQTGTYINEEPQVRFVIEYQDQQGAKLTAQYKKVVPLLDLHKISKGPIEIMYLPTHPQNIIFYEDLIS